MRKIILSVITLLFVIWIMPLGFFIKPSQEKIACNGQRAICLCSHLMAKQASKKSGEIIYKSGVGVEQKEASSSGGPSHQFLLIQDNHSHNKKISSCHQQESFLYAFLAIGSIEHVPKLNLAYTIV